MLEPFLEEVYMRALIIIGVSLLIIGIAIGVAAWASGWKTKKGRIFVTAYSFLSLSALAFVGGISYSFDEMTNTLYYKETIVAALIAHSWLVTIGFATPCLLILGIWRWRWRRKCEMKTTAGISRRDFFTYGAALIPGVIFAGSTVNILRQGTDASLREISIQLPHLPDVLEGHTIGHISDMHLGPYSTVKQFQNILRVFAEKRVHRVCITGDLIDNLDLLEPLKETLIRWAPLFPQGIQYILGNHEYYRDKAKVLKILGETPITILRNSHIQLYDDEPIYMAGVDFPFHRSYLEKEMHEYLEKAMAGIPQNAFTVLLAHHPDFIGHAFKRNIPLTLAGHSHGGQINLGHHSLVTLEYTYWRGLYEHDGNIGYVSTGAGDWFPVRMDCPREYTIISLHKGVSDNNMHNQYS